MYSAGMLPVAPAGQQSYVTHPGIVNQVCVQPYNAGSAVQLVGSLQPAEQTPVIPQARWGAAYQPAKALKAPGDKTPQDYRCGYCGIHRTSSSSDAYRRVRIRCGCGGIKQDQNTRTHAHWLPLSRIPLHSFLVESPVMSSEWFTVWCIVSVTGAARVTVHISLPVILSSPDTFSSPLPHTVQCISGSEQI